MFLAMLPRRSFVRRTRNSRGSMQVNRSTTIGIDSSLFPLIVPDPFISISPSMDPRTSLPEDRPREKDERVFGVFRTMSGQGCFQVESEFVSLTGECPSLDQSSVTCQTVLSKCLGSFKDWESRLEVSFDSGYNLIHFTPIQILSSISNSSYAIRDHHRLNSLFDCSMDDLKGLILKMEKNWKIYSITDLVYNHVSTDCPFLVDHPESTYNLVNSPHLKAAVLLDSILMQFTRDAQEGKLLQTKGIPAKIEESHLQLIRHYLFDEQIRSFKFWEFYICPTEDLVDEFRLRISLRSARRGERVKEGELKLEHGEYNRMGTRVDLDLAEDLFYFHEDETTDVDLACQRLRDRLNWFNHSISEEINEHLNQAIDNCLASCRYHFFSIDGPRYSSLSLPNQPFVGNYFHYPHEQFLPPSEIDRLIQSDVSYQSRVMAHNGWVMHDDPLRCFADEGQQVYLRRDLLQWSDIVKLRFGSSREECPSSLYEYVKEYTRLIATTFHGCRLDNCHSTPLWLAQQMMDYARELNPNFYINAELFTGHLPTDIQFINQIGINSLVRESYRAFDPAELGQIGSSVSEGSPIGSVREEKECLLKSSPPYCWFYDQTHDNPSQLSRRCVEDLLPRSSIVSMSNCSTGSNRGYDQFVPHHIDVVHESRFYSLHSTKDEGMIPLKRSLNHLHSSLAKQGFTQLLVDQLSSAVLLITRHNPRTHQSIILVAHCSFTRPIQSWEFIPALSIEGNVDEIVLEGSLQHDYDKEPIDSFVRSREEINGLIHTDVYREENLPVEKSRFVRRHGSSFEFTDQFRPGSIIVLQVTLDKEMKQSVDFLKTLIEQLEQNNNGEWKNLVNQLTFMDLERILYRSSLEEQSDGEGIDVYSIPGHGSLHYCGLQGLVSLFSDEMDLHHPLILNLKQGNWLMDYISHRLVIHSSTKKIGEFFSKIFSHIAVLSRLLIPIYFLRIIRLTFQSFIERSESLLGPFINQSSQPIRQLGQTSLQLLSVVLNARLPLLSPHLREPRPNEGIDRRTLERIQQSPSLAAGLPHFSEGIWRNWGRDTFISLRALLLLTGRFDEARWILLSYGQCLRHGLIPNLLGDGKIARYNARDAVWWWIYSISVYCQMVPDGHDLLSDRLSRLYPTNDSPMQNVGVHDQSLYDVIQEVFLRHLQSLSFRERGAGHSLDSDMNDQGFNNQIGIDWKTGFVFGGNQFNCGTWMDKMGSSERANNKGHPATPRDGSAIELVGLLRASLAWIIQANQQGFYPYDSVETSSSQSFPSPSSLSLYFLFIAGASGKTKYLFTDWLKRIDENFEKEFWIDSSNTSEFVNRRQIYKDTVNSSFKWTDFQFRPNFLVAAVLAPEMFDKTHIWLALEQAQNILLGPFGMKTLDPRSSFSFSFSHSSSRNLF